MHGPRSLFNIHGQDLQILYLVWTTWVGSPMEDFWLVTITPFLVDTYFLEELEIAKKQVYVERSIVEAQ